jgi:uncharacterized protein YodC (DUF2158 family)
LSGMGKEGEADCDWFSESAVRAAFASVELAPAGAP